MAATPPLAVGDLCQAKKAGEWQTDVYRVLAINSDGTFDVRTGNSMSSEGEADEMSSDTDYGYTLKDKKYPDEVKELSAKQKAYITANTVGGKLPDLGGAKTTLMMDCCQII